MNLFTKNFIAVCSGVMGATVVFAHDGHGLTGTHWHATDVWGFIAVTAMLAVAVWLYRK